MIAHDLQSNIWKAGEGVSETQAVRYYQKRKEKSKKEIRKKGRR